MISVPKGVSVLVAAGMFFGEPLWAASLTPELQKAIRANTFEVVMKKPEKDPLTYEKPLPLDLLPYIERTDAYRSVGTAFALGHNRYVTAAHVLIAGVDSQYGAPALRQADGAVYEIDQILKFSAHQDFVVFSLKKDPAPQGFDIDDTPQLDDPVMAVGNALGEGIVIRDGLYTSATAEEQDGRWKWIRFSAAASPGNSGGPLLDARGRVMGIVIGKSANENLNYSLPMTQVLQAPDQQARFDERALVSVPYLQGTQTYRYKDQFELPLSWSAFAGAYLKIIARHDQASRATLLKTYADTVFPKGSGTESLLYAPEANGFRPRLVTQQADNSWTASEPDYTSTDLGGDGTVSVASAEGVTLLRLVRPDGASDDAFYRDSRAFMDLALKGLNLRRAVGTDQVRITSLGAAVSETSHVDHYGRIWQGRVWAVPFLDLYLDCWLLPTPEGYSGFIQYMPSGSRMLAAERSRALVDLFDVSYKGTVAQWRAHLARRPVLPKALMDVVLETGKSWSIRTKRFVFNVPPALLSVNDKSVLTLTMGFFPEGAQTLWDIQDVWWNHDSQLKASIGLVRRLQPPKTAKLELRSAFEDMRNRHAFYSSELDRESSTTWRISRVLDVPAAKAGLIAADVLYSVILRTDGAPAFSDLASMQTQVANTTQILEKGLGESVVPAQPVASASSFTLDFDARSKQILDGADRMSQQFGKDLRGRTFGDDMRDLLTSIKPKFGVPGVDMEQLGKEFMPRADMLAKYWGTVPALRNNRDLWGSFLLRNRQPMTTPHSTDVLTAERTLVSALGDSSLNGQWVKLSQQLTAAYVSERQAAVREARLTDKDYRPRQTECPPPATATSGSVKPEFGTMKRTPHEFYPKESQHKHLEGTVVLSAHISANGCADRLAVAGSSGDELLDEAALQYAETMEFLPATRAGKPVEADLAFKVTFKLWDAP
jgi:serine protease Do